MKSTSMTLSSRQKMVLMTFVQQAMLNPELAADLVVNPRPMLRSTRLTEEDIDHIADFLATVDGFKRGGTSADTSEALEVNISDIDREVEAATLTDNQINTLTMVLDRALDSSDALQEFVANAQSILRDAGLTTDDLTQISVYIATVQDVIELDRSDDWIG
ncbi:MAG: hypothetical protein AAFV93_19645 [Chloroflexota bacterium]